MIVAQTTTGDLIGSCTACLSEAISQNVGRHEPADSGALSVISEAASAFHARNGTSRHVRSSLAALSHGAPIVRFAHQPNLLPYLGVIGQFFFVWNLARSVSTVTDQSIVPAYFIVDYDTATDRRFRTSLLPQPRMRHGMERISYPIGRQDAKAVAFNLAAPNEKMSRAWSAIFDRWADGYQRVHHAESHSFPRLSDSGLESARQCLASLFVEYRRHRLFAWGNAAHLSHLVNTVWRLPVVFIPLSVSAVGLEKGIIGLAERLQARGKEDVSYAWYVCSHCYGRTAAAIGLSRPLACATCGASAEPGPLGRSVSRPRIVPKVVMDNLADYALYGVVGGIGYGAGVAHMRDSRREAKRIGQYFGPEMSVRFLFHGAISNGIDCLETPLWHGAGRAFDLVSSGRASLLYYLSILGYESLGRELDNSFYRTRCAEHT